MFREVYRRLNLRFALFFGILLLFSPRTGAQLAGGLRGTITDPSGAPVPNAHISIKNLITNNASALTTDARGFFSASDLPPGNYSIMASMPGFSNATATVAITSGNQNVVSLTLQPANNQPGHKTPASSSMGGVVSSETVRDMPVNGRDWTQAATLQAGVSSVRTQPDATNTSSGRGQRGFGAQISVSGGRPQQNNYLLDGISINDYANAAPGSVLGLDLGADAVEEFSVVTSNYPATYGRSSGGVINAVTRSGSNAFHGTVYEFLRNSVLDARNFFDVTKPPFRRNQFGASAGAPIQKDRAFFFANYEGLRQSLGTTQVDTVLSAAARGGQLSSGNVTVDSQVAPYLAFYPLPNGRILPPGDTGIFTFSGQQVTGENYFTTRLDRKFREHDNLSGTYVFDTAKTIQPDKLDTKLTGVQ
ncbi:MAG TPA: TonB-dependent receptor, partial [Terriglobales bacterium]|nr:TonB-dependent receptor [Terriglobales bacterium]